MAGPKKGKGEREEKEKKGKEEKEKKGKEEKGKKGAKVVVAEQPAETETKPEEEDPALAKRFKYKSDVSAEQLNDFYECCKNLTDAAAFAKEAGFRLEQCLLLYKIGLELMYILTGGGVFAEAEKFFKERFFFLSVKEYGKDAMLPFSTVEIKKITRFFTTTFFQHYSLYRLAFLKDPVVITKDEKVTVQTAKTSPLIDSFTAEELELIKMREEAIKAAAELKREQEEEAAAKAAAQLEAAQLLEENMRKPQSLEEAIEFAVREKVAESKKILEEEYQEREEALIKKLSSMNAQASSRSSVASPPGSPSSPPKTAGSPPPKTPGSPPKSPASLKAPASSKAAPGKKK